MHAIRAKLEWVERELTDAVDRVHALRGADYRGMSDEEVGRLAVETYPAVIEVKALDSMVRRLKLVESFGFDD